MIKARFWRVPRIILLRFDYFMSGLDFELFSKLQIELQLQNLQWNLSVIVYNSLNQWLKDNYLWDTHNTLRVNVL